MLLNFFILHWNLYDCFNYYFRFIENNIFILSCFCCCLYPHIRNQDVWQLFGNWCWHFAWVEAQKQICVWARERNACFVSCFYIMPSKRRSRRRKTVGETVHMQVPCPDALPRTATENTCNQLLPLNTPTDLRLGSNDISSHTCESPGLNHSCHKMILYMSNLETHQEIAKHFVIHRLLSSTKPSLIVSPNPPIHSQLPMLHCRGNTIPGFALSQAAQHPSVPVLPPLLPHCTTLSCSQPTNILQPTTHK